MVLSHNESRRLRVGVVGVGRVGSVLGAALQAAGHRVVAASGLSDASLGRARDLLPGVPIVMPEDVVARADLVLLAVPDAALPGLVAGLAARRSWWPGQIVAHTSTRYGIEVLEPATRCHALPVVLSPAMRFCGSRVDLERLPAASIAVTTTEALRPVGEALVVDMGAEPVWVPAEEREKYAAALAHALGYVQVVVEQSAELLVAARVPSSRRVLAALMLTGLEDALRSGVTVGAMDDPDSLRGVLEILDDASPDSRAVHLAVARARASRAYVDGRLTHADLDRLLDVLGTGRDGAFGGGRTGGTP